MASWFEKDCTYILTDTRNGEIEMGGVEWEQLLSSVDFLF